MTKVYQCDRCKTIFEPRVLAHGEPYIARKGKADLDLCPNCYNMFTDFINATSPGRASYVDYHTITVLEEIKSRLLPSMTEENEALDKTIKAMRNEPYLVYELAEAKFKRQPGEWISTDLGWKCSACGYEQIFSKSECNYCMKCGAKMEAEDD